MHVFSTPFLNEGVQAAVVVVGAIVVGVAVVVGATVVGAAVVVGAFVVGAAVVVGATLVTAAGTVVVTTGGVDVDGGVIEVGTGREVGGAAGARVVV